MVLVLVVVHENVCVYSRWSINRMCDNEMMVCGERRSMQRV